MLGRRVKLSEDVDQSTLRKRNFPYYSDDSIDVSDIVNGPVQSFDPNTGMHLKPPQEPEKLRWTNFSDIGTDSQIEVKEIEEKKEFQKEQK